MSAAEIEEKSIIRTDVKETMTKLGSRSEAPTDEVALIEKEEMTAEMRVKDLTRNCRSSNAVDLRRNEHNIHITLKQKV